MRNRGKEENKGVGGVEGVGEGGGEKEEKVAEEE